MLGSTGDCTRQSGLKWCWYARLEPGIGAQGSRPLAWTQGKPCNPTPQFPSIKKYRVRNHAPGALNARPAPRNQAPESRIPNLESTEPELRIPKAGQDGSGEVPPRGWHGAGADVHDSGPQSGSPVLRLRARGACRALQNATAPCLTCSEGAHDAGMAVGSSRLLLSSSLCIRNRRRILRVSEPVQGPEVGWQITVGVSAQELAGLHVLGTGVHVGSNGFHPP